MLAAAHGAGITAQVAAQIAAKASTGPSAFGFSLEPQGLGRVDVSLRFDPQGQISAVLSFDNPAAAAEARGRAADLAQSLQQAGFDVSQGGLSFTSGGQNQSAAWQGGGQPQPGAPASRMFADAPPEAPRPIAIASRASRSGGIDITI
jgi:Meckel syndrome type 1 protein